MEKLLSLNIERVIDMKEVIAEGNENGADFSAVWNGEKNVEITVENKILDRKQVYNYTLIHNATHGIDMYDYIKIEEVAEKMVETVNR
jgi:hypothetical protein